ncbi:glycosyltransferase family 9 protein [bacterium]|nr:glycosyltransferase family 9 protein [bacterium]MBU1677182.1 glycosyltransferase family 9 protein [bacterium]
MPRTLIIRFGALGDLCICGWFVSGLAAAAPGTHTTLVTKEKFAALARAFDGVDEVKVLPGRGLSALLGLARSLGLDGYDTVLDAHGVLRSHLLTLLMRRRPDARIRKDTGQRLRLLRNAPHAHAPLLPALNRSLLDRFLELTGPAAGRATSPRPPLAHLRPAERPSPRVGLAPGARWDSKRWPDNKFANLIDLLRECSAVPVTLFLGPDETPWYAGSRLAVAAARHPDVDVVRDRELIDVAGALARCSVTVTNDSGLLHLAEATGTPVVALFGPTVRAFGYYPLLPQSRVLELALDCRPCSRTGSRPCHRGDLACLEGIEATAVRDAVLPLLGGNPDPDGGA